LREAVPALPPPERVTFATLNTGLARGFVPHAAARVALVARAVARDPPDVLCLQELWRTEDADRVIAAVRDSLPHVLRASSSPVTSTCTATELDSLNQCWVACQQQALSDACVDQHCKRTAPSSGCRHCIAAAIAAGKPGKQCLAPAGVPASSGLALLSRWRLSDANEVPLAAPWLTRSVLGGRVHGPTWKARVFCTHLPVPLARGLTDVSWSRVQERAIDTLIGAVAGDGFTVVMGDFNTGPETTQARGFFPALYGKLEAASFRNAYASRPNATCSRCDDNPLVALGDSGGVLIDHVLVRDAPGSITGERAWTTPVALERSDSGPLMLPISDHYGVRAVVEIPRRRAPTGTPARKP
jgi:endonuclease/exonuclease/phosphatase family metal-dependent hydrolase